MKFKYFDCQQDLMVNFLEASLLAKANMVNMLFAFA